MAGLIRSVLFAPPGRDLMAGADPDIAVASCRGQQLAQHIDAARRADDLRMHSKRHTQTEPVEPCEVLLPVGKHFSIRCNPRLAGWHGRVKIESEVGLIFELIMQWELDERCSASARGRMTIGPIIAAPGGGPAHAGRTQSLGEARRPIAACGAKSLRSHTNNLSERVL